MLSKGYIHNFVAHKGIPPTRYNGEDDDDWDIHDCDYFLECSSWSDWITTLVGLFMNLTSSEDVKESLTGMSFKDLDCSYCVYETLYKQRKVHRSFLQPTIISRRS